MTKINSFKLLSEIDKAYIAGFLDGDGSILTQIVKDESYKFKFYIRISIAFYQKSVNYWFLLWLNKVFAPHASLIKKASGMSVLTIVAKQPVEDILKELQPYLKIKKPLCKYVLGLIKDLKQVNTEADFLKVCKKVDETANYTYSKGRVINTQYVQQYLGLPVETFLISNKKTN
jgi:hypothetical protein